MIDLSHLKIILILRPRMHKLNIVSGADPHQRKAVFYRRDKTRRGRIRKRFSKQKRDRWPDRVELRGRHCRSRQARPRSTLRAKMDKTWKSTTVVLVEVIFRTDDPANPVYFGETLPSYLRRRSCRDHTVGHRAFIRQICPVLSPPRLPFG